MISILTPSRGRPEMLLNMIESAPEHEHIVWVDLDDEARYTVPHYRGYRQRLGVI